MKRIFLISLKIIRIFFVLLFLLISCARNLNKNVSEITIDNGNKLIKINVEIADDTQKRINGLMFRERLNENEGMLFIFEKEEYQAFWMKNTLISLDMIFIDKNFRIVDIKSAVPCKEEPCILYKSSKPAKYVLEVDGNFTIKNNIKIGDGITINKKQQN